MEVTKDFGGSDFAQVKGKMMRGSNRFEFGKNWQRFISY